MKDSDVVAEVRAKKDELVLRKIDAERHLSVVNVELTAAKLRSRNKGSGSRSRGLSDVGRLNGMRTDIIRAVASMTGKISALRAQIRLHHDERAER